MEWVLVAVAVGLVVILVCDVADEVAYWWSLRRTEPRRGARATPDARVMAMRDG